MFLNKCLKAHRRPHPGHCHHGDIQMKLTSFFSLLAAIPIIASANERNAEELILCLGTDDSTIAVELWKPTSSGVTLHCLYASFSSNMTACAPNGGWGLGSDDNMTTLVDAVNDWETAHNHEAGKVAASAGTRGVRFIAHSGVGVGNNLNYIWKFSLESSSGRATWYTQDGGKLAYACEVQG
jgi:hypothetical protein